MTVKEYFERYIAVDTQSDSASGEQPSTSGQLMLGMILVGDLLEMGVHAQMDEFGYVYGEIPASAGCEERPAIGLIAHMDTVADAPAMPMNNTLTPQARFSVS